MVLVGYWPDRRWIWIFGPREAGHAAGWRNRMIMWGRNCVPFRPERDDLLDTTRRAVRVLKDGYILGIAGEGRLSDKEGDIVPLHDGAAFFALRGGRADRAGGRHRHALAELRQAGHAAHRAVPSPRRADAPIGQPSPMSPPTRQSFEACSPASPRSRRPARSAAGSPTFSPSAHG